jgi:chemotaxis protein methyltransferase CheR
MDFRPRNRREDPAGEDARRGAEPAQPAGPASLSTADFRRLARFIESELGIRMPDSKRIMIESRLQKRIRHFGYSSFGQYVDFVFSDRGREGELINMIDAVTTNKTDFFREADHFDYLIGTILPEAQRRDGAGISRPLGLWSAGCSTGEEPYTIAMVLQERCAIEPRFSFRIFASDLSTKVLEKAREGIYDAEKAEVVPMSFKRKYMLRSKDKAHPQVRMKPELRSRITFARINFMDDRYPVEESFDVVFCRNVIIYFERRVQEAILRKLCDHIRHGGWLVLGHSETLTGMEMPLRPAAPTIYARI